MEVTVPPALERSMEAICDLVGVDRIAFPLGGARDPNEGWREVILGFTFSCLSVLVDTPATCIGTMGHSQ